jgi:hypothetical protein
MGNAYQFSDDPLSAGGFGPADATIRVRPGPVRTTLIRPRNRNPFNDMWSMQIPPWQDKSFSLFELTRHFERAVDQTVRSWLICVKNMSTAYVRAVKGHRDALNKADKSTTALQFASMWSAVSVFATGGASLGFGKDLTTTAASALKDMVTTATGAIGNVGPTISNYFQDAPDGAKIEPQEYQNELEKWILKVRNDVDSKLQEYDQTLLKMTRAEWARYDVNQRRFQLAEALDKLAPLSGMPELSAASIDKMANTLEKHFWAEWILTQCSQQNGYQSVPGAVADRLNELGILREAGTTVSGFWHTLGDVPVIGIISAELGHTSRQEDRKLLAWANKFKVNFAKSAWSTLAEAERGRPSS